MPGFCSIMTVQDSNQSMPESSLKFICDNSNQMTFEIYNDTNCGNGNMVYNGTGMNGMFPNNLFGNNSYFNCNLMDYSYCDRINISIWTDCPANTTWETSLWCMFFSFFLFFVLLNVAGNFVVVSALVSAMFYVGKIINSRFRLSSSSLGLAAHPF